MLRSLPRESAFVRAADTDEQTTWGDVEHLLALVVDLLAVANWQRQGNKNASRPKPVPRPGDARRDRERGDGQLGTVMTAAQWEARRARRLAKGGKPDGS